MRRRKQIRLKGYDYSQPGAYFVSICTKERRLLFGEIINGRMIRNNCGDIVRSCWDELPTHYPHVQLDEFQVMPNHIHGIIFINDNIVGSRHASTLRGRSNILGDIVGSFKSAATKRINEIRKTPGLAVWQPRYHDHIIRNEISLNKIREYIRYNPQLWKWNKDNPVCHEMGSFDPWLVNDRRTNGFHG